MTRADAAELGQVVVQIGRLQFRDALARRRPLRAARTDRGVDRAP